MARPKSRTLTPAELRIMNVLWKRGSATVAEIQEDLRKSRHRLAYTTVLTTLQILEQKRVVRHEAAGKAYVYHPMVAAGDSRNTAVRDLLAKWFDGSANALFLNLYEELSDEDRAELRALMRRKK